MVPNMEWPTTLILREMSTVTEYLCALETFRRKRPTDAAFDVGLSLPCDIQMALLDHIMEIIDQYLLIEEDDARTRIMDCITERALHQ